MHLSKHEKGIGHHASRRVRQGISKELDRHRPQCAVGVRGRSTFLEIGKEGYMTVWVFVAVDKREVGAISLETLNVVVRGVGDWEKAEVEVGGAEDWTVDRIVVAAILVETQLQRDDPKTRRYCAVLIFLYRTIVQIKSNKIYSFRTRDINRFNKRNVHAKFSRC